MSSPTQGDVASSATEHSTTSGSVERYAATLVSGYVNTLSTPTLLASSLPGTNPSDRTDGATSDADDEELDVEDVNELPLLVETDESLLTSAEFRFNLRRCARGAAETSSRRNPPRVARWKASKVARSADSAARGDEDELRTSGVMRDADQWLLLVWTQGCARSSAMVRRAWDSTVRRPRMTLLACSDTGSHCGPSKQNSPSRMRCIRAAALAWRLGDWNGVRPESIVYCWQTRQECD